jgi:hypothetical protein
MKVYPKEDTGSATAGGPSRYIYVKFRRKTLWLFAHCTALLKEHVVRENYYFILLLSCVKI